MAKKDKTEPQEPMHPELDKDSRKRLEKMEVEWDKPTTASWLVELKLPDLRLLLEHHQPLQDLIRAIAATGLGSSPLAAAQANSDLQTQLQESTLTAQDASAAQAESESKLLKLREQCKGLQADLAQCSAATQQLLQDKKTTQTALSQTEKQLQQAHKELNAARAALARHGAAPAELQLLQHDAELARRLELADLPEDTTQALIRVVAVLAQRENMERLWTVLKERCEAENRTAHPEERALLAAALSWYNHNWRNKPYKLLEVPSGTSYDFERHLRSQHTTGGEKIRELRLPGIADGSGRVMNCKPLVSTQ